LGIVSDVWRGGGAQTISLLGGASDELSYLVQRCAAADEAALRRLYDLQAARLKGLALRITGSAMLAEDVLHDVFVRVWQEARRFDPERGSAAAWLTTLTRFRAMDLMRSHAREHVTAELPEREDGAPDALALSIGQAQNRRLQDCLGTLPEAGQKAIRMAFLDGLTHAQIAQRHGMPLGTLKSLIRRSLRDLKGCMEP
jgi:RNA polymerase sigma-70 factor (ECF subfamily)